MCNGPRLGACGWWYQDLGRYLSCPSEEQGRKGKGDGVKDDGLWVMGDEAGALETENPSRCFRRGHAAAARKLGPPAVLE